MSCQSCGNERLTPILSLGYMPPVNSMRPIGAAPTAETWMPTDLMYCDDCDLVQLDYIGDPSIVFPPAYPYTSASTKILRENFAELASEATKLVGLTTDDLVVDIGSNDGTLLSNFNCQKLGVEPTDIADLARRRGIKTEKWFFNFEAGRKIRHTYGPAQLVTCANCFAHMTDIGGVIEGIKELLAPGGTFISESHYLIPLLDNLQYDTIYHEHLRYYSLTSLANLLSQHGLSIERAKYIPTHGGSIRVYAKRTEEIATEFSLEQFNEPTGDVLLRRLKWFANDVRSAKLSLMAMLYDIKRSGARVVGISAPSRASTVVSYCRLDNSLVDYVCEINGSLKLDKYMPGTDIPVVSEDRLFEDQPDYAILFSHHIADELIPKLRSRGFKGDFIFPCGSAIERKRHVA